MWGNIVATSVGNPGGVENAAAFVFSRAAGEPPTFSLHVDIHMTIGRGDDCIQTSRFKRQERHPCCQNAESGDPQRPHSA